MLTKKLRSVLAFFMAGLFTSLIFASSVWSLNADRFQSVVFTPQIGENVIAFGRSSSRQRYLQQLEVADRFYNQGAISEAIKIQKEVKEAFTNTGTGRRRPIDDPEQLSGGARSYYRNGKSGLDENLITKALIPLQRLSEDYPEFIQGHIMLAQAARKFSDNDSKIVLGKPKLEVELEALERGSSIFPERKDLLDAKLDAFLSYDKFIEASVTARQFATLFPSDPDSSKYLQRSELYLNRHRKEIADKLLALGFFGSILGGSSARLNIAAILSMSESEFGSFYAEQEKQKRDIISDPEIVNYVDRVGQKVAKSMGRNEFKYEFYVYRADDEINAFALPGGKIFIASGILNAMGTEAELAGLLGHEVGHAVLSHSYIKIIEGIAAKSLGDFFGISDLLAIQLAENSRSSEKQSDILGTRSLAASGYSADGMWNVARVLKAAFGDRGQNYMSTHPAPSDRVGYLEDFITRNAFNRYAYEGVSSYRNVMARLGGGSDTIANSNNPNGSNAISSSGATKPVSNSERPRSNERVSANSSSACPKGKVSLAARQERNRVTVSLDGAFVATSCSSFTANVRIKNSSDRPFTFVPGFIKVFSNNGDDLKARLTMKKGSQPSVGVGETAEAEIQVFKHRWTNQASQDLVFELKEGSSVARVFRLAF
jgi:Zn-dependent protease with chaperone function